MQILLTELAVERYGDLIRDAAPDAGWLVMDGEGSLTAGERRLDWEDAAPDVAWFNAETFDRPLARRLFGFLLRSDSLRWIQFSNAGLDHPVFAAIAERGAVLTNAHVGGINISEYVLGQVLSHRLGLRRWDDAQRRRSWEPHEIRELSGARWLVVGLGAIGTAVATRARAFGCSVVGVRRTPAGDEPVDEILRPQDLAAALPAADVVVLSAPGTSETEHLVDDAFLERMREGSILVNVARGSLIDEAALLAALDRGVPELAVLDVAAEEPLPPESPLWTHPRVVVTPHSSGNGDGHFRRGATVFCDNLRRYVAGEPLGNVVDPRSER